MDIDVYLKTSSNDEFFDKSLIKENFQTKILLKDKENHFKLKHHLENRLSILFDRNPINYFYDKANAGQ